MVQLIAVSSHVNEKPRRQTKTISISILLSDAQCLKDWILMQVLSNIEVNSRLLGLWGGGFEDVLYTRFATQVLGTRI